MSVFESVEILIYVFNHALVQGRVSLYLWDAAEAVFVGIGLGIGLG